MDEQIKNTKRIPSSVADYVNWGLTEKQAIHLNDQINKYGIDGLDDYAMALKQKADAGYSNLNPLGDYDFWGELRKTNNRPSLVKDPGGYIIPQALTEMAILEGGAKALSVPSLNEGEDEQMQKINTLNKQKYLESLSRGPSSENDWYRAMDAMSSEAYKANPNLFRPTYIGDESGYSYASPQSSKADYNIIAPALQKVYGTPENYMIEGYKNLEQESKNPKDYNPTVVAPRNKKALLEQLYPKIKS